MKKALAILSILALGSASQSDGFLSDNELHIRPVSYNPAEDFPLDDFPRKFPRDPSPILYADDDEQYARPNIVKNWHYPLKPLPMTNQNQPKIEKESVAENVLFDLRRILKQQPRKKEPVYKPQKKIRPDQPPQPSQDYYGSDPNPPPGHMFYLPPTWVKNERQHH